MNDDSQQETLLHQDEAFQLLDSLKDKKTRGLTSAALTTLWHMSGEGSPPPRDFDLLYFTEVLVEFFSKQDLIARVLDGTYQDCFE